MSKINKSQKDKISTPLKEVDGSSEEELKTKKHKSKKQKKNHHEVDDDLSEEENKLRKNEKKNLKVIEIDSDIEEDDVKPTKNHKSSKEKKKKKVIEKDDSDLDEIELEEEVLHKNKHSKNLKAKVKGNIDEDLLGSDEEDEEENLEEDNVNDVGDIEYDEDDLPPNKLSEGDDESKMVDVAHLDVDMNEINLKIQNLVDVLTNFKEKKEEGRSRGDYILEFKKLLMIYYDYNSDLTDLVINLFPPNEVTF